MITDLTNATFTYLPIFGYGVAHWGIYIIRKFSSLNYKRYTQEYHATTSVIIPVYKEKPQILKKVLDSILRNKPNEIITVIDHSDDENITVSKSYKQVKTIITPFPGKRHALATGITHAKGEIVVLVDSDTMWLGNTFLTEILKPFNDSSVGGVGSRQNVYRAESSWRKRFVDWMLDTKYLDYVPSMSNHGVVTCLSGRTAAYRRKAVVPSLSRLVNEKFLGKQCVGGDDVRLTSLVLEKGYKTVYQDSARAVTYFSGSITSYLGQKVRWSRNSYRGYTRAIGEGLAFRRGWMYLLSIYHCLLPGLTYLLFTGFLVYSLVIGDWLLFAFLSAWAVLSRMIKSISHLRRRYSDIVLLPFVAFYYTVPLTLIKIYSLLTVRHEKWSGSRKGYKLSERQ